MSSHISDELPRLLTGDANRDVVMTAAEHLRICPDCQQDLVSAVVAHAALTSAHRFAPEIVANDASDDDADVVENDVTPLPLPDMSSVFAQARDEAAAPAGRVPNRRRLALVAAAAAVVVGGGGTVAAMTLGSSSPAGRSVALSAFPSGNAHAKVVIDDNALHVNASSLPPLDSKHVYELWVTDSQRKNMSPVGTFSSTTAELTADHKVLSQYNDFEVSVQRINQIKDYSGISVVRGQYG